MKRIITLPSIITKPSKGRTFLLGLAAGVAYAFLAMLLVNASHKNVSVTYIFLLPTVLGAIPVLFSTREQLHSYKIFVLLPWGIILTFFFLSFVKGLEGMICLVIITAPFLLLGTLGAFIFRLIGLKNGHRKTPLYASLLLPFLFLPIESTFQATDQFHTVSTTVTIHADKAIVWENIKNVRNIQPTEVSPHFIHWMGIPKPLNGELDQEGVGGIRRITWEKGIKFQEVIRQWEEGKGFAYAIHVDPASIPPTTLDEHVMIGGRYFDVVEGSYRIDSLTPTQQLVTLTCQYRVTTNLNFYSQWWADLVLDDFHEMILEVIQKRCEASERKRRTTTVKGTISPMGDHSASNP